MAKRDNLLRYLHSELRMLESLLDKPLPMTSHAEKQAVLKSVRAMRCRVWNEGRNAGLPAVDSQTNPPADGGGE